LWFRNRRSSGDLLPRLALNPAQPVAFPDPPDLARIFHYPDFSPADGFAKQAHPDPGPFGHFFKRQELIRLNQ